MSRRATDERGAAAVEMALIMPLLFMLLFGIVVFGIQLFRAQSMQSAVREGGRLAAVGADLSTVQARILGEQTVVPTLAELDITVLRGVSTITAGQVCRNTDVGTDVTVTAAVKVPADYALSLPFVGDVTPDFVSKAVFRCE